MKQLLLLILLALMAMPTDAQEYPKVILPGDYPDPSIMREGEDYYMTHSPFFYAPGFLIWHSKDLVNWEPICRACPEYEGSAMAPDLLKYKDKYYIYYPTSKGENYVIYADNIRGPWSKPVKLSVKGIDPGHVVGENGRRYLFTNNGWVAPLSDDGLKITGENKKVYDGWIYPEEWETEGDDMYLESPKLLFKDGYYYMTSAEGGTAGPATSHMCVMARSRSIFGPWENSPYNPVVHTYSATDNWWSKGHGTLIDDVNGNWWMVYHAYAKGYHTLGRQTLIEPMEYSSDGWFRPTKTTTSLPSDPNIKHGLNLSDDFTETSLGMQWTFWKEYAPGQLSFKNNTLRMNAKGSSPADGRLLLITPEDKYYETQVDVQVGKGNKAGLVLFYNEKAFAGVVSDGKNFIIYKNAEQTGTIPNKTGRNFKVKLMNQGNKIKMMVSKDGDNWTALAEDVDVSDMHHNNYKGFFALRVGLLSCGKGHAEFGQFRYQNAVTMGKK